MTAVSISRGAATRHDAVATLDTVRQAAAQIYERLRSAIIALDMPPGGIVDRTALQTSFGRSSTPIRDALSRLAEEGLVDIVPQSATRISLIDVAKARDAQFLRRALELEAVETVARDPDKSVVAVLRDIIADQKVAAADRNLVAFDDLDREFHRRLLEAAGAIDLHELLRRRSGHIERIRRLHLPVPGKPQEIIRAHGLIAKAIASGDVDDARKRVKDHLSSSLAYTPALREKHPAYFKV